MANYGTNTVSIFQGNGLGGFGAATTFATGGYWPDALAVADFNGDGKADLAVTNGDGGTVGILLGNGSGGFSAAATFLTGSQGVLDWPQAIATGDFNNDGKVDLAVTNTGTSTVGILLGDGAGGFGPATVSDTGGAWPQGIGVGDFNGDGNADIVVANHDSNNLAFLYCDGAGGFLSTPQVPTAPGTGTQGLVVADFNGDGIPDVAGTNSLDTPNGTVFLETTFNGPLPVTLYSPSGLPFDVSVGSVGAGELIQGSNNAFDGDGWLRVGGAPYRPSSLTYSMADNGQSVVTAAGTVAGLTVSREVTVPNAGNEDFARTIDTFTNSTGAPITTTVQIVGNLGSDAATHVFATSDGTGIVSPNDQWIGTDGGGVPATIHYIHGPLGLMPVSVQIVGDNITWTYNLTVDAGATVRLGSFTILGTTEAAAEAAANALVTSSGFGNQAAAYLSPDEVSSLVNFVWPMGLSGVMTPPVALEGAPFSDALVYHFTVPDSNPDITSFTATITWGDGTTSTVTSTPSADGQIVQHDLSDPSQGFDVLGSHLYVEELSGVTFSVQVTDGVSTASASTNTFSVADQQLINLASANLPPYGHPNVALPAIAGLATFTDPAGVGVETIADFTATIHWGDGTTSPGTIVSLGNGDYRVDAPSHTYVASGNYTVNVTVRHEALPALTTPDQVIAVAPVFWVTNLSDGPVAAAGDLPGSLRQAIFDANAAAGADTIRFAAGLSGTITLTAGELLITDSATVQGPGAMIVTVDADNKSRVFEANDGSTGTNINVEVDGLTLTGGNASAVAFQWDGGGILSLENLTVRDCTISGNSAFDGGGISEQAPNGGTLLVWDSIFSGNHSLTGGGVSATTSNAGTATIQNSVFFGNSANDGGGIQTVTSGSATTIIEGNTIFGNGALGGGGINASNSTGTTIIRGNAIYANNANGGAGITVANTSTGTTTIQSNTIFANSAVFSAGGISISCSQGAVILQNDTISGNTGTDSAGLKSSATGTGTFTIQSTIIAGNIASSDNLPDISVSGPLNMDHSLIGDCTGTTMVEAPVGARMPTGISSVARSTARSIPSLSTWPRTADRPGPWPSCPTARPSTWAPIRPAWPPISAACPSHASPGPPPTWARMNSRPRT